METKQNQQPEVQMTPAAPNELQLIQARSAAQFALTPIGQQVKQFEVQQRMAQMYSTSTIVPDTYRGNLGNCVIAIDMAMRMNANPLMVIQNLYIVHGQPSFSSKFLIATINASGRFTPLRYEFRGTEGSDEYACRVFAYESWDKEHKEPLYGDWVSIGMAKKEGWFNKGDKGVSKWATMPSQMLRYRAAAFWQRVYCPEISMGLMTSEEVSDIDEQVSQEYLAEIRKNANAQTITIQQDAATSSKPQMPEPGKNANGAAKPAEQKKEAPKTEQPVGAAAEQPLFMQNQ